MVRDDRDSPKQFDRSMAALKAAVAELETWVEEVKRASKAICDGADGARAQPPRPVPVIEGGRRRYVSDEEADRLWNEAEADLMLDARRMKLRYVPRPRGKKGAVQTMLVNWSQAKILLTGMAHPDRPFGDSRINDLFTAASVSQRSLSRYMVSLTKALQGGGTNGPYITRRPGLPEVSTTGWAYVFNGRWRYLIIERPRITGR